jgi:hypothetical protein
LNIFQFPQCFYLFLTSCLSLIINFTPLDISSFH